MRNEAVHGIQIINIKEICSLVSIIPAISTQALCDHFFLVLFPFFCPCLCHIGLLLSLKPTKPCTEATSSLCCFSHPITLP